MWEVVPCHSHTPAVHISQDSTSRGDGLQLISPPAAAQGLQPRAVRLEQDHLEAFFQSKPFPGRGQRYSHSVTVSAWAQY